MALQIHGITYDGQSRTVSVEPPDVCPICHAGIEPKPVTAVISIAVLTTGTGTPAASAQVVFLCTRAICRSVFIAYYDVAPQPRGIGEKDPRYSTFLRSAPIEFEERAFDKSIKSTSEMFVRIYNQALKAEAHGLDQLAGPGYRKALEFLVKDYTKTLPENAGKDDEIERAFLGPCVSKFVSDAHVKSCASRAVWLGNDETHYIRTWLNKGH